MSRSYFFQIGSLRPLHFCFVYFLQKDGCLRTLRVLRGGLPQWWHLHAVGQPRSFDVVEWHLYAVGQSVVERILVESYLSIVEQNLVESNKLLDIVAGRPCRVHRCGCRADLGGVVPSPYRAEPGLSGSWSSGTFMSSSAIWSSPTRSSTLSQGNPFESTDVLVRRILVEWYLYVVERNLVESNELALFLPFLRPGGHRFLVALGLAKIVGL